MYWKALHSYGVGKRCTVMVLESAAQLGSWKGCRNAVHNCQTTMVSESAGTYLEITFQDTNELDTIYCNIIIQYILMNISTLTDISCSILIYSDSTLTTDFICLPERFLQVMVSLYYLFVTVVLVKPAIQSYHSLILDDTARIILQ